MIDFIILSSVPLDYYKVMWKWNNDDDNDNDKSNSYNENDNEIKYYDKVQTLKIVDS